MTTTDTAEAQKTVTPAKIERPKLPPRLTPERFKEAAYVRNVFAMTPAVNTEVESLLAPDYWAHIAAKLHPGDHIEVLTEDNSFFAEILVIEVGKGWARVVLLRHVPLNKVLASSAAPVVESKFKVNWGGMNAKHRVVRLSDNQVIKDGFSTADAAKAWMQDYEATAAML